MPQIQTVLTSHKSSSGNNARGGWTLHIFTDSSGQDYKTFESALGNKAFGALNQNVTVTYEEKPGRDPQYPPDRILKSIEPAADVHPNVVNPTYSPAVAPTQTVPTGDEKELRIMRQSALERALRAHSAGLVKLKNYGELIQFSERLIDYFKNGPQQGADGPTQAPSEALVAAQNTPEATDPALDAIGF